MGVRRVVPDVRVESARALAASREFYGVLGLEPVMDLGWVVTLASPENPTAQLTLATRDATAPVMADISIEVSDVDAAYAAVVAGGARIVHGPRDEEWGVRRFFAVDPNGRVVNVVGHR
jgi:catechol 2,3-dioxygenase-like lactoylglutathione lyase family enzyme